MSTPASKRHAFGRACVLGVLGVLGVSGGSASAQGIPVIDNAAVTQAVADVNAVTQQVQQLTQMVTLVRTLSQTVGQGGTPGWLLSLNGAPLGGITPYNALMTSAQTTSATAQAVAAANQQMAGAVQTQLNPGAGTATNAPDFSTYTSALNWVQATLVPPANATLGTFDLNRSARTTLAGQTATSAYALALTIRQQAPQAAARTQSLAQQVSQASDLRGDVEANTAVMLAIHDEMAQVAVLMASLLAVDSAARLAGADPSANTTAGAIGAANTPAAP